MADGYLELYKKYRPQVWDGVRGASQRRIADRLRNDVASSVRKAGYILSGPHGCGKTTLAKLLSKALNCTGDVPSGGICGVCRNCVSVEDDTALFVDYISAANNGGVEVIRKKMELIGSNSMSGRRGVLIIDEAHNLHSAAFDSMLIPLEAKDVQTTIVLCTTADHKIPATIMSRIENMKVELLGVDEVVAELYEVADREEYTVEDRSVLERIARLGRGSMRDSLTLFENFLNDGVLPVAYDEEVLRGFAAGDYAGVLGSVIRAEEAGVSLKVLTENLVNSLSLCVGVVLGVDSGRYTNSFVDDNAGSIVGALGGVDSAVSVCSILVDTVRQMGVDGVDARALCTIKFYDVCKIARMVSGSVQG